MKIAIHKRPGSFSDRWIEYCNQKNINYKIVNCYDSDIINQLKDCSGLMWHWNHGDYREQNFARQLIISIEKWELKYSRTVIPAGTSMIRLDRNIYLKRLARHWLRHMYFTIKKAHLTGLIKRLFPKYSNCGVVPVH